MGSRHPHRYKTKAEISFVPPFSYTIAYDTTSHRGTMNVSMAKQHNSKATNQLLKELKKKGFIVSPKSKKGTIKIIPPASIGGPIYTTHGNESAFHPMKRDFARLYNIEL